MFEITQIYKIWGKKEKNNIINIGKIGKIGNKKYQTCAGHF